MSKVSQKTPTRLAFIQYLNHHEPNNSLFYSSNKFGFDVGSFVLFIHFRLGRIKIYLQAVSETTSKHLLFERSEFKCFKLSLWIVLVLRVSFSWFILFLFIAKKKKNERKQFFLILNNKSGGFFKSARFSYSKITYL